MTSGNFIRSVYGPISRVMLSRSGCTVEMMLTPMYAASDSWLPCTYIELSLCVLSDKAQYDWTPLNYSEVGSEYVWNVSVIFTMIILSYSQFCAHKTLHMRDADSVGLLCDLNSLFENAPHTVAHKWYVFKRLDIHPYSRQKLVHCPHLGVSDPERLTIRVVSSPVARGG